MTVIIATADTLTTLLLYTTVRRPGCIMVSMPWYCSLSSAATAAAGAAAAKAAAGCILRLRTTVVMVWMLVFKLLFKGINLLEPTRGLLCSLKIKATRVDYFSNWHIAVMRADDLQHSKMLQL